MMRPAAIPADHCQAGPHSVHAGERHHIADLFSPALRKDFPSPVALPHVFLYLRDLSTTPNKRILATRAPVSGLQILNSADVPRCSFCANGGSLPPTSACYP